MNVSADRARAVRPLPIDFSDVEDVSAAPVAEVVVTYGGTTLDVKHIGAGVQSSRRRTVAALVGAGAATLVAGFCMFAHEVAQDWDAHRVATIAALEQGRTPPEEPGLGIGGWALVLGLLGIVPLSIGLARREQRRPSAYTVGERADATFHTVLDGIEGDTVLPLVANGRIAFTAGMTGAIATGGRRYPLHELVEDGRARAEGSFYTVPLPPDARCTIEHGALAFRIDAVAPGRVVAGRDEPDRAFWAANAISLVAIGGLLVLAHFGLRDADALDLDDQLAVNRYVGYISQPDRVAHELATRTDADDERPSLRRVSGDFDGREAAGAGRNAGDPKTKVPRRRASAESMIAQPAFARARDPEGAAERAGILGQIHADPGRYFAQAGGAFTVGVADDDVWSGIEGGEIGTAFGDAAAGLLGSGRGGGYDGGGIGLGDVGLIGARIQEGERVGGIAYGHGRARLNGRSRRVPVVRAAAASVCCGGVGPGKDVIRRVVRSHINEVRHCYNQGLVRAPSLQGRVAIQFRIDARGSVQTAVVAESTIDDANVGRCIANAVKRWRFPASERGVGSALVTYPFVLAPG